MSLKPVEMQIAIPRTTEATHFQNQLIQKPALDQAELADANAKRSDQQRNMSEEIEKTDFLNVREDGRSGRQYGEQPKKRKPTSSRTDESVIVKSRHPFKGKHIDLSL